MDPLKKEVTKRVTGAALKAAKKRAAKTPTTSTGAAASKTLGQGKSVTAADVGRAAKPSGRGNPAARKLGVGQRPQPADIAKSKAPNAAEAAKSLKSKSAQRGGAARQATGNKSGTTGKFEKGQKKAPLTRTEKAGIAGAAVGTTAFLAKDRDGSKTMADKMAPAKKAGPKGSTEAQMESARAAEKKRYEARKAAALARAKAQSDFYKKKKDSEKGYLRDSEGKRVKSGSGEDIRTGYYKGGRVRKPLTAEEMKKRIAQDGGPKPKKAKPTATGYKCGGEAKKGYKKGGLGKGMKK
jgi:hypothetical protein